MAGHKISTNQLTEEVTIYKHREPGTRKPMNVHRNSSQENAQLVDFRIFQNKQKKRNARIEMYS